MFNFWPILKREMRVYFNSPIAYAVLLIFLVVSGFFFYSLVGSYVMISFQAARNPYIQGLNAVDRVISPMFGNLSVIMLLMLPLFTMRLFAEEKKSGTYELLFSYPLRDVDVLLGKYLAALALFLIMIALTAVNHLLLYAVGASAPGVTIAGFIGIFLLGAAFIALGVFVSSLTENQIVAAVITFGVLLLFWIVGWASYSTGPPLSEFLQYISLTKHIGNFAKGVIDTADVAYYLLFNFFFLFLTLRSLESKRWRG
jgi:ABC-2 type transport system permease protein